MEKKLFVMLPKYQRGYSNEEMYLLALIQALENKFGYVQLTIGELMNYCGVTKEGQSVIIESLEKLEEKNHMKVTFKGSSKNSIIKIVNIKVISEEEKAFIQIYVSELKMFLDNVSKSKVIPMFNQFAYIVGCVNRKEKMRQIAFPTIDTICKTIGKSERTIRNYNEELEELKLLYSNNLVIEKEIVKKVYSRYEDRADVDEAINEAVSSGKKTLSNFKAVTKKESTVKKAKQSPTQNPAVKSNVGDIEKVKSTLSNKGLDFNKSLSSKIQSVINEFKTNEVDGAQVVIQYIQDVLFKARDVEIRSKNGFIMSKLNEKKEIEKIYKSIVKSMDTNKQIEEKYKGEKIFDLHANWEETIESRPVEAMKTPTITMSGITGIEDSIFNNEEFEF